MQIKWLCKLGIHAYVLQTIFLSSWDVSMKGFECKRCSGRKIISKGHIFPASYEEAIAWRNGDDAD